MKKNILIAIIAGVAMLSAVTSHASQGGATHYVSGQFTDFSGGVPTAPGWVLANYVLDYNDGTLGGSKGLPLGGLTAVGATVNTWAEVPIAIYAYPFDFLGGTLSSGATVPIISERVKASATLDTHFNQRSGTVEQTATGLGDMQFLPLMAGWTNGDFKFSGMFSVWAPTGDYDRTSLANTGLGYWTFEPMFAATWLSQKLGTEVSLFTAVDFNTANTEANYTSGNLFHIDATVAQHFPLFGGFGGVGASAFWMKQISNDTGSGAVLGGFQTASYGVGPTLSYVHPIGKHTLIADASWLPQLHSVNTTKGDYFWVKLTFAF